MTLVTPHRCPRGADTQGTHGCSASQQIELDAASTVAHRLDRSHRKTQPRTRDARAVENRPFSHRCASRWDSSSGASRDRAVLLTLTPLLPGDVIALRNAHLARELAQRAISSRNARLPLSRLQGSPLLLTEDDPRRGRRALVSQPALERHVLRCTPLYSAVFTVLLSVVFTRCSEDAAQDRPPAPRLAYSAHRTTSSAVSPPYLPKSPHISPYLPISRRSRTSDSTRRTASHRWRSSGGRCAPSESLLLLHAS